MITSSGTASFAENGTGPVYTATATDPDTSAPFNTLFYSLSGADAALFNIDTNTGVVTFKAAPNFENPQDNGLNNVYDITVIATDGGTPGLPGSKNVAITVTNVNEAPTDITLSALTIEENLPTGTVVGVLGATDQDIVDSATYTLVNGFGDDDNSSFMVSGTQLITTRPIDFNAQPTLSIRLRAADSQSAIFDKVFSLLVLDSRQAPVVQLAPGKRTAPLKRPIVIDPSTVLVDPDSEDYAGGSLRVSITQGAQANDTLGLNSRIESSLGRLKVAKGTIKLRKQVLGTLTGGTSGQTLEIQFQSGVTRSVAQDILRNVTFAGRSTGLRTIGFQVTDSTSSSSALVTRDVEIL